MSDAEKYARWVLDPVNKVRTGKYIKMMAEKFLSDLQRTDIFFDEKEADLMISFCEKNCNLCEGDWEGQPMKFEPWMKFIFQQVFGWIRKDDGRRRVTKIYVQIGKKNAKTTLLGMLGNFHLFRDKKVNTPRVFVGANNEDQAKLCVNIAGKIIESSPRLNQFIIDERAAVYKYEGGVRSIAHFERGGSIKAMSKETGDKKSKTAGGKHGINASLGVIDEYGLAADSNLLSAIESSMASRRERLIAIITTAGYNLDGPCYSVTRKTAIDVLEGHIQDDSFLPFIFEIDPPLTEEGKPDKISVSWLLDNPEVWEQANPNINVSVYADFLKDQLQQAKNGAISAVDVLTLNFNLWQESAQIWIPKEVWDANSHGIPLSDLAYCPECFAGIEIISGLGLNALVMLFPNLKDDIHGVVPIFWMPEGKVLPHTNDIRFDFSDFVNAGHILTTPGNAIENDMIFEKVEAEMSKHRVHSGAFITHLEKHDIIQALMKSGQTWNPISKGYQGQSTPTKAWEELLMQNKIEHFGNPVLSWMNSNCMVLRKDNEVMLQKSGGRIAGISACIQALAQYKTIEAGRKFNDAVIESWK